MPLKISVGKEGVDVSNESMVVTVLAGSTYMPDIYNGTFDEGGVPFNHTDIKDTLQRIKNTLRPVAYMAVIGDGDKMLESNEKGFL
ncbi:MAG: hypothetical protein N3E47_08205 [Candidatus Bathyarchaeota archaeon]|nr:hypothetical protein [Candidatus Bathyarchaeota archaeon]